MTLEVDAYPHNVFAVRRGPDSFAAAIFLEKYDQDLVVHSLMDAPLAVIVAVGIVGIVAVEAAVVLADVQTVDADGAVEMPLRRMVRRMIGMEVLDGRATNYL